MADIFEMDFSSGKLKPVVNMNGLKTGTVIHYTGDCANLPKDKVIIRELDRTYEAISTEDEPKKSQIEKFSIKTKEEHKPGDRYYITDKFLAMDEVLALISREKAAEGMRILRADTAKQEKERYKDKLLKDYAFLEKTEGLNGVKIGCKNIRAELKRAFPGSKFSVVGKHFSMGNDISVSYTDGAKTEKVEAITKKYEYGHFNCMEDIYEYSRDIFTDIFGGTKYLFVSRNFSNETAKVIFDKLIPEIQGNLKAGTPIFSISKYGNWEIEGDIEIIEGCYPRNMFAARFNRLLMALDFSKVKPENYNPKGLRALFWEW